MNRLVLTGGGTGGHIYPALALAAAWLAAGAGNELLFLGSRRGMEAKLVPAAGLPFRGLPARGWRGKHVGERLLFFGDLARAFRLALGELRRFRPDAVLATGSFVSLPVLLAARALGLPYFLQEQNSVPGMLTRRMASGARALFLASADCAKQLVGRTPWHVTGNPLRPELVARAAERRPRAPGAPRRLLIFGGSRGARSLNEAAIGALPRLAARHAFEAVVQTGPEDEARAAAALASLAPAVRVLAYIENMPEVMAQSDWVVCRSGAMTLAEISLMALPAILVPYPHAVDDHQSRNAEEFVRAGAARLIPDAELDADRLHDCLARLWSDPETERAMSLASAAQARPHATRDILALMDKSLVALRGR